MDFELEESTPPKKPRAPETKKAPPMAPQRAAARAVTPKRLLWKRLRQLSRIGLYTGFVLYVSGAYIVDRFERKMNIDKNVRRNPIQQSITEKPFSFEYHDEKYVIQPIATYDISGLVVTHNDISSIFDAYHTKHSVDFRDICLVWGANVGSGIYLRHKFWSMPWSCHYQALDNTAESTLVENQISNNHLIAADDSVRNTIINFKIGDQIRLTGKLINYWRADFPEYSRQSSTTREDTGNGACEVVWVESAELLKRAGSYRESLRTGGKWLLILSVILGAIILVAAPLERNRGN